MSWVRTAPREGRRHVRGDSQGFPHGGGGIFAWLNSDDMYMPWATCTMERIIKSGHVQWCTGIPAIYNAEGLQSIPGFRISLYAWPLLKRGWYDGQRLYWIQQESCFWTRALYERAGGLDTRFRYAGDYDLWRRFAQYAPLYSTNVVLGGFRIHEGQKSAALDKYREEQPAYGRRERFLRQYRYYAFLHKWHLHRHAHFIRIQQCPEI